jgi:hypothetical protein
VDEGVGLAGNRWTMPLLKLGEKRYYLGIFFKVRNKCQFLIIITSWVRQNTCSGL